MALKATIFKIDLQIADMDRHFYGNHSMTIARHPSENDLRMMFRLATYCLNAHENLKFCKGVSTEDEPDLWQKSLGDEIEVWIDLGQPDEKRIRKACGRAKQMNIYTYQPRSAPVWWEQNSTNLQRFHNLSVFLIKEENEGDLLQLVARTISLQANIQDGELWLGNGSASARLAVEKWKEAKALG